MRLQRVIGIALACAAAGPLHANPALDEAEIAEARASLEAGAEEAAEKSWPIFSGEGRADGLDREAVSRAGRWWMASFSVGWCARFAELALIDELDASLYRAIPGASPWALARVREEGTSMRRKGASTGFDGFTPGRQRAFCAVELEAVRQVLADL